MSQGTHGTHDDFLRLVAPHRGALRLHCRMLGSTHDSDDAVQETLVRAWRARDSLADPAALRPWLYRIATNTCLDELKDRKGRPLPNDVGPAASDTSEPPTPGSPEVLWLEPCPDAWLAAGAHDPGTAYELKESVALAFVAALQCLTAQQRAVLLLRDVLGLPAEETADVLDMSTSSANSTLHRARAALRDRIGGTDDAPRVDATSDVDGALLSRYIRAWESLDLEALVALLHDDITVSMPPSPMWLDGKSATTSFLAARPFTSLAGKRLRLVPCGANGQPAVAFYVDGALHAVQVLRLRGGRVLEMHHFLDPRVLTTFELPAAPPARQDLP